MEDIIFFLLRTVAETILIGSAIVAGMNLFSPAMLLPVLIPDN